MRVLIEDLLERKITIPTPDKEVEAENRKTWDRVAKPLDSMGKFEILLSKIGGIQRTLQPDLDHIRLFVLCADNGVVEEGISQSDQSVTAICAENIGQGLSSVGIMAKQAQVNLLAVDIGMNTERSFSYVEDHKIRKGTRNFAKEPAMTEAETMQAIQLGMDLVRSAKEQGYTMVATGEMGIGNTTTSSAVVAALLHKPAEEVTGRGAGLSTEGLLRKVNVIRQGLDRYGLYQASPLRVLSTVGGLDLAGMAGICIGGAMYGVPVILDGLISMSAALVACRLLPEVRDYLIPSHTGKEPAIRGIEEELHLDPVIDASLALGEGTGAVMVVPLLRMANAVYRSSIGFEGAGLEAYSRKK